MGGKAGPPALCSFTCTFYRLRPSIRPKARLFTTTTSRKAIPPESPNFVDVPSSFQADLYTPRRQKGTLPVPRELFPSNRPDKPSARYIQNVTPDAKPENITPPSQQSPLDRHRNRMTALRKKHLRSSLVDLHEREETITQQISARSRAKLDESDRLRSQAIREDERLTNVSIPRAMLPQESPLLTARKAHNIWYRKRQHVKEHQAALDYMNSFALHSLYMNARNFITTEEQLLEEIEATFKPGGKNDEFKSTSFANLGENIWTKGVPSTVKNLIQQNTVRAAKNGQPPAQQATKFRKDQERMKRIAEELSGGKI